MRFKPPSSLEPSLGAGVGSADADSRALAEALGVNDAVGDGDAVGVGLAVGEAVGDAVGDCAAVSVAVAVGEAVAGRGVATTVRWWSGPNRNHGPFGRTETGGRRWTGTTLRWIYGSRISRSLDLRAT